ncbi:hypothetical protein CKAH01_11214 [Colletotrichum kahawae]|uniref:Uncharacterized protein n=1 Tax=Colletotrichum kahawae TaxID=34407 RepID=A0AAE0CWL0_COLKA|nr:hypothetical protein CKAH01_11214 [Colletotrichum kahawae]
MQRGGAIFRYLIDKLWSLRHKISYRLECLSLSREEFVKDIATLVVTSPDISALFDQDLNRRKFSDVLRAVVVELTRDGVIPVTCRQKQCLPGVIPYIHMLERKLVRDPREAT